MASRTAAATTVLLTLLAGCSGPAPGTPNVYATPSTPVCTKQTLTTRTPGRWTVGTSPRAAAPWFSAGRPENGRGFESAVAYAVAERLGFAAAEVSWTRVPADEAVTAGAKPFDVGIDLFAHSRERKKLVDMSSWYYLDRQAVVALKGSAFAAADTLAELRNARLGARSGSTGALAAATVVQPATAARLFDDVDDARRALWRRQLDGVVVDLPQAFAMAAAQPDGLVVVGQLPRVGVPDQFGLVLEKGSPLTPCVRKAVDDLRVDGTLLVLEKQWLVEAAGVPELA